MTGKTLVYGVGLNDANYVTQRYEQVDGKQKLVWACPIYQTWKRMLKRANCKKYLAERPTYQGVTVCMEWRTFSCFASWMKCQDWEGKQLDKDLLHPGNKEYSEDADMSKTVCIEQYELEIEITSCVSVAPRHPSPAPAAQRAAIAWRKL